MNFKLRNVLFILILCLIKQCLNLNDQVYKTNDNLLPKTGLNSRNKLLLESIQDKIKSRNELNPYLGIVNKNDYITNEWLKRNENWSNQNSWTSKNPNLKTNGWWNDQWNDPWKDPLKKLTLVKIKPEISEVYAADVLIREHHNSNLGINGFVQFVQFENYVEINGIICNLPKGKHAIHIHKFGEISNGCDDTLGDFNPYNIEHGAPELKSRHLGDLGNIEANATGIALFKFKDKQIKLNDKVRGIIGRSIVIHEFEDDLGSSKNKESFINGDSGGKLACGVIGISQASNYATLPMECKKKKID